MRFRRLAYVHPCLLFRHQTRTVTGSDALSKVWYHTLLSRSNCLNDPRSAIGFVQNPPEAPVRRGMWTCLSSFPAWKEVSFALSFDSHLVGSGCVVLSQHISTWFNDIFQCGSTPKCRQSRSLGVSNRCPENALGRTLGLLWTIWHDLCWSG